MLLQVCIYFHAFLEDLVSRLQGSHFRNMRFLNAGIAIKGDLTHTNMFLFLNLGPCVTPVCKIATATESHETQMSTWLLGGSFYPSRPSVCTGGTFSRDAVDLNFPKSRFCCNRALQKLPNHPSLFTICPQSIKSIFSQYLTQMPTLEVFFNAVADLHQQICSQNTKIQEDKDTMQRSHPGDHCCCKPARA